MDAPALCDSILQFVGSGLPAEGSASNLPATGVAGEAAEKRVSEGGTSRDTLGDDAERTGSYAASGATEQQLQKQGLMRAFMGNKARCVRIGCFLRVYCYRELLETMGPKQLRRS